MERDGVSSDDCSSMASEGQQLLQQKGSQEEESRHRRVSVYSPGTGVACAAGPLLRSLCSTP
jgi:hypothetical protein